MSNSFLSILNSYFSNIPEENILSGDKHNIEIPFEWLFTEQLDREIIQKALVNIFMQNNSNYRGRAYFKHNDPDKLNIISIQFDRFTNSLLLFISGADEWSKLVITDEPNSHRKIPQITSSELIEEISKTLKQEKLDLITNPKMHLSTNSKTTFAKMLDIQASPESVNKAMCELAENLIEYYKDLINVKENNPSMIYGGVIEPRQDEGEKNKPRSMIFSSPTRKSPIYSFAERSKVFGSLSPDLVIASDSLGDQGQLVKNSYTTYVFKNPRDFNGYLFICEPLEGFHLTRAFFIPEEKFKEYKANDTNKFVEINKDFVTKSNDEFRETRFTKSIKHTDIDSFTDRISYFVSGKKTSRISNSLYKQFDSQLFGGEVVTKSQIRDVTIDRDVKSSDVVGFVSVILPPDKVNQLGGEQK